MMARDCRSNDWFVYSRFGGCRVQATCLEAITVYHKNAYFEVCKKTFIIILTKTIFLERFQP